MQLKFLGFPKLLGFVAPAPAPVTPTTEDLTAKVLNRAAELIHERGWTSATWVDSKGRMCALGAIDVASSEMIPPGYNYTPIADQAKRKLCKILGGNVSTYRDREVMASIYGWNDGLWILPSTRVQWALRRAAKAQ
jgi:hypothetical protein